MTDERDEASEALVERLAEALYGVDPIGTRRHADEIARAVLPIIRAEVERAERDAAVKVLREVEALTTDHAMLCGKRPGGSGCFRPSCSCWCHRYPEGVVSVQRIAAHRERIGGGSGDA